MKKDLFTIIFIIIFSGLTSTLLFSQKKSEFSAGVGILDLVNIKYKYGTGFQAGFGVGVLPPINVNPALLSVIGDFYYHFPHKADTKHTGTWYLNSGLDYIVTFESYGKDESLMLFAKAGRKINFKNNTGINFDLGAMTLIWPWGEKYDTGGEKRPVYPAVSLSYFIKLF